MKQAFHFRFLRDAIQIFCGNDVSVIQTLDLDAAAVRCERFIGTLPVIHRWGSWLLLCLFRWGLPPFPFRRKDPELYLKACERGRWMPKRLAFVAVRFLCVCSIYSDDRLLRAIGYGEALEERRAGKCPFPKKP